MFMMFASPSAMKSPCVLFLSLFVFLNLTESLASAHYTVWEGGTSSPTSGISHSFLGLDTSRNDYFLTVDVYQTDFLDSSEYVDGIYAGSSSLSSYCNPGVDYGGSFYRCISNRTVTNDVTSGGILTVLSTATSSVDCCAHNGYTFYAKYALTAVPLQWEGGTNSPVDGVQSTFSGLNTSLYTYQLSVEVYETDFAASNEYVDGIYAGGVSLSSSCNPGLDSGGSYFVCIANQTINSHIEPGGSLTVLTTATSSVNCCSYNGYYLYVKYTLVRVLSEPAVLTWEGGTDYPLSGVEYIFYGLDTSLYSYTLTVEVYETDFYSSNEYITSISAGGETLSSYCNPGVDSGSSYYLCVSNQTVTNDITSYGSLTVLTTATSEINCCPYNGYYLYVRYSLHESPLEMIWEGGTNSPTSGVHHTFGGLDTSSYVYYLTVEVYKTDFSLSSEYVQEISAGGVMLSTFCNPGVDLGGSYYLCAANRTINDGVSADGSLTVTTVATSDVNCCPYMGYYLYVKYSLSRSPSESISLMVWEGGTNWPSGGVVYTFYGLDVSTYTYALSVDVYETDFSLSTEYVDGIVAGGSTLSSYCNPSVDSGGSFFQCVVNQTINNEVTSGGSLTVTTTATSDVNCCGYSGYYLYVKYKLKRIVVPSTRSLTWEGGTNAPFDGVAVTFLGLDTSIYRYYLTVLVYETNFYQATEYVSGIYAGDTTLSSFCNPGVNGGRSYYQCVGNHSVLRSIEPDGSLRVHTVATIGVDCCEYRGYYLYVKYILSRVLIPTTSSSVWEGGTNSPATGVSVIFTGLNFSLYQYSLTVEVYETNFASSMEYVDGIYAGNATLSSFCNPGRDWGGFYPCITNQSIAANMTSSNSLAVHTTATVYVDFYPYNGYHLYVKYHLSKSYLASSSLEWEGGTNAVTTGVYHTFTGLDTSRYAYGLTVKVYQTDFASSNEYVNSISLPGVSLSSYCNPGVDAGGSYYVCLSNQTVTDKILSGSLTVITTATSDVNCCSYHGYYLYVKYILHTSHLTSPSLQWEGGTTYAPNGVFHVFTGLDTSLFTYTVKVEVYCTDFAAADEYVDGIYAEAAVLSSYCNPGMDAGGFYYSCMDGVDVSGDITSSGSLAMRVTGTSTVDINGYLGYVLYVRFTLTTTAVDIISWEGGSNQYVPTVFHNFYGLNARLHTYLLTVEVYANDYDLPDERVTKIEVAGSTLSLHCDPQIDGSFYYPCLRRVDVTSYMMSYDVHALRVYTYASSYVNEHPYNGYNFYVRYSLQAIAQPHAQHVEESGSGNNDMESGVMILAVSLAVLFGGLICAVAVALAFRHYRKSRKESKYDVVLDDGADRGVHEVELQEFRRPKPSVLEEDIGGAEESPMTEKGYTDTADRTTTTNMEVTAPEGSEEKEHEDDLSVVQSRQFSFTYHPLEDVLEASNI